MAVYSPAGTQPYLLKMLTKNIKVCAGCRLGYNNTVPPYDMCIVHEETRPVPGKSFNTKTNVHYHANPQCIWYKDPSFAPADLQVPMAVLTAGRTQGLPVSVFWTYIVILINIQTRT
jgi:hypothetical protein